MDVIIIIAHLKFEESFIRMKSQKKKKNKYIGETQGVRKREGQKIKHTKIEQNTQRSKNEKYKKKIPK